ncbi:MAG: hypothetical protein AB1635_06005 [Acidobacteriota bacterium]
MITRARLSLFWVALATTGALASTLGPDAGGYTATDETAYSFVNIASTGVRTLAGTDDAALEVPIGFSFELYGQAHADVCISSNGLLSFGGCTTEFANQDLTAVDAPNGLAVVAPYWTDLTFLRPTADAVYYETLGTAPNRQFVVQWNSAFPQTSAQPVTVQVVLHEGTNLIVFQYDKVDVGAGDPASNGGLSTVGICAAGGRAAGRCLQWSHAAPVIQGQGAIAYRPPAPATGVPGAMHGQGFLRRNGARYQFTFDVRERATGDERARFDLRVDPERGGGRGDRFRSRTVTSVQFSDDPTVQPGRNPRPMVDTVLFTGTGEWNGRPGYRYEVLASDEGEPGRHRESIRIRVWDASNAPVVDVAGVLDGGNVQSVRIRH